MRGLLVHHEPEPTYRTGWAHDEAIYNTGFAMWSEFDGHFPPAEDRFDFTAERMRLKEIKRTDYMNRWMDKPGLHDKGLRERSIRSSVRGGDGGDS